MEEQIYFAYGSNINLTQMAMRCPDAIPLRTVTLKDYELSFRGSGVATIIPQKGARVHGVLWKLTPQCQQALDRYEGFPVLYKKESVVVKDRHNTGYRAMVYIMSEEFAMDYAEPPASYLKGIMQGYRQNELKTQPLIEAVSKTRREVEKQWDNMPWIDFKSPYTERKTRPKNRGR